MTPDAEIPTSAAPGVAYAVTVGDASADEAKTLAVWRDAEFGIAAQARSRFEWFYRRNPEGPSELNLLQHLESGATVGSLGVGRRTISVGGETLSGGVLVDYVVHPAHRSAGPALLLQRKARERALSTMSVLYGLPDTKARAIFKRLGADFQCELPRYARIIRSRVYLDRMVPSWLSRPLGVFTDALDVAGMRLQLIATSVRGQWTAEFDEHFDALWERARARRQCIGLRDRRTLNWRFREAPHGSCRIFTVTNRDGALLMYFVCQMQGDVLGIKDCLAEATEAQMRHGLLQLTLAARAMGASAISFQMFGNARLARALRRTQFIARESRPFFAMTTAAYRDRMKTAGWYITQADEDV